MIAASNHVFSFGAAGFATLAFLAIKNSDTCNENAATDNQPSPYATNVPMPDFHLPISVCEMDTDAYPLNPEVVHTARRNDDFHASNMWQDPAPAFHGLPYSYGHWRRGRWHHFVEVIISTSIVARELWYNSPKQYVEA
jgi:hypothetical protein